MRHIHFENGCIQVHICLAAAIMELEINPNELKFYSLLLGEKEDISVALTTKFTFNGQIFI